MNNNIKRNTQCVSIHEKFADILDDNGLTQLVKETTRGENTLDLIVTNYPSSFRRVETLPGLSDHDIVYSEITVNPIRSTQKLERYHYTGKLIGKISKPI